MFRERIEAQKSIYLNSFNFKLSSHYKTYNWTSINLQLDEQKLAVSNPTPWPRRNSPEESPRSSYPHCCKGLACALLGLGADALWKDRVLIGRILATFICLELKHQADWLDDAVSFRHFRDKDKMEVDLVLECGGRIAGVEMKASSTVTGDDFKGLRKLQQAVENRFVAGVVMYDGEAVVPFGNQLYAVPISGLWEK